MLTTPPAYLIVIKPQEFHRNSRFESWCSPTSETIGDSSSRHRRWHQKNLVGGFEPWNFMTFHILGIIIPTDELHSFSEGLVETTRNECGTWLSIGKVPWLGSKDVTVLKVPRSDASGSSGQHHPYLREDVAYNVSPGWINHGLLIRGVLPK